MLSISDFHKTLRSTAFDPNSVTLDVPPELLANIAKVERAIAAGKVTPDDTARIAKFMEKYTPMLTGMREHAERKARLWWNMAGQ